MMCSDKYVPDYPGHVSLKEFLERIIDLRFASIETQTNEARRLMEKTMDGFPEMFLRKGEIGEDLAKLTAKVDDLLEFKSEMKGAASSQALEIVRWVAIMGAITGLLAIILRFFKL